GLMQLVEIVDTVGDAIGKPRIVLEGPALVLEPRYRVGDRDRAVQFLQRAVDQRAVRPRAAVRDVEVIAAGLRLVAGRTVGRDAVAELALGAAKVAFSAGFLRQLLVAPYAVDQHAHVGSPQAARSIYLGRVLVGPGKAPPCTGR